MARPKIGSAPGPLLPDKSFRQLNDKGSFRKGGPTCGLWALVPELLALNQAPDFIEDYGRDSHYGDLTEAEERALIEFMKTF